MNRLEQDGFGFDLGPSILTMPHIFEKLFQRSSKRMADYVLIKRLNREWRSFFPVKPCWIYNTIYLVNVNKTDPTQAPPGHENLKILPHISYIQDKPFTPEDYRKFEDRVLDKLERMGLHGLRDNIVTRDVWTPHDIERIYESDRGAIYGTVSDKNKNGGFKHKKQSELYNNLYFVGGTVNPGDAERTAGESEDGGAGFV